MTYVCGVAAWESGKSIRMWERETMKKGSGEHEIQHELHVALYVPPVWNSQNEKTRTNDGWT